MATDRCIRPPTDPTTTHNFKFSNPGPKYLYTPRILKNTWTYHLGTTTVPTYEPNLLHYISTTSKYHHSTLQPPTCQHTKAPVDDATCTHPLEITFSDPHPF